MYLVHTTFISSQLASFSYLPLFFFLPVFRGIVYFVHVSAGYLTNELLLLSLISEEAIGKS